MARLLNYVQLKGPAMLYARKRWQNLLSFGSIALLLYVIANNIGGGLDKESLYQISKEGEHKSKRVLERDNLLLDFHQQNKGKKRTKRLPDIIGIGAEKCGTGWLQYALRHHPMIRVDRNEVQFFNNEQYRQGMEYYKQLLPNATENELVMEKSPGYFNFGTRETPQRIKTSVPNVKLWLVLCDPVYRTYSDFIHERDLKHSRFQGSFDKFVDQYVLSAKARFSRTSEKNFDSVLARWHRAESDSHILTTGIYYHSLKRWLQHFSFKNLMVISGEEIQRDSGKVVEQVQEFFKIPKLLLAEDFVKNPDTGLYCITPSVVVDDQVIRKPAECYTATEKGVAKGRTRSNSTSYKPNPGKLKTLKAFFEPYDNMLFDLIGRRLW